MLVLKKLLRELVLDPAFLPSLLRLEVRSLRRFLGLSKVGWSMGLLRQESNSDVYEGLNIQLNLEGRR